MRFVPSLARSLERGVREHMRLGASVCSRGDGRTSAATSSWTAEVTQHELRSASVSSPLKLHFGAPWTLILRREGRDGAGRGAGGGAGDEKRGGITVFYPANKTEQSRMTTLAGHGLP